MGLPKASKLAGKPNLIRPGTNLLEEPKIKDLDSSRKEKTINSQFQESKKNGPKIVSKHQEKQFQNNSNKKVDQSTLEKGEYFNRQIIVDYL